MTIDRFQTGSRLAYPVVLFLMMALLPHAQSAHAWVNTVEENKPSTAEGSTSGDSSSTVLLSFAGDCTFTNHFEDFVGDRVGYPFERFDLLSKSDISMVNLENPITLGTQKVKKEFNFRMDPKYLKVLQLGGVDVVTVANNHIFDYGTQGLLDTIHFLDSVGIKHVGAGRDLNEARKAVLFDIKGLRIGFLGCFGTDAFAATSNQAGVAPRSEPMLIKDIRSLKQIDKVDFVVVNIHWGREKALYPQQWQVNLAHSLVDAGADLVVGHHPHVLQGVERYKNAFVAYSLGNFLFGGNSRSTYDTAVLKVELGRSVRRISIVPIHVKDWQPSVLSGLEGERVVASVRERSRRFRESIF
jgi:poly-gamma-glutamate capsule biosynthesis protein CapA/YwtB (metallophosphatase superfamily)